MIEANLDRSMLEVPVRSAISMPRIDKALEKIGNHLPFDQFITQLVERAGISPEDSEDCFWELIDNGQILLDGDFTVSKQP